MGVGGVTLHHLPVVVAVLLLSTLANRRSGDQSGHRRQREGTRRNTVNPQRQTTKGTNDEIVSNNKSLSEKP